MGTNAILKHGGDKPIQFDLNSFKKKSIYSTVSETELADQIAMIDSKENDIKKYKYWQDFDRIYAQVAENQALSKEKGFQKITTICVLTSLFLTNIYIRHFYQSQFSFGLFKKYYFPILACVSAVGYFATSLSQISHVMNEHFYRQITAAQKCYRALDEEMNLYKYVDDIKYNFDFSRSNITKTRNAWNKNYLQYMETQIEKQYQNSKAGKNSN